MRIITKVTPKAQQNKIVPEKNGIWRIYVTAAPENDRANRAVQKLLAKHFKISLSSVVLFRGETSRQKIFDVKLT